MTTYTTCPACGLLTDQERHCAPRPEPLSELELLYRDHLLAGRDAEADYLEPIVNRLWGQR